MKQQFTQSRPSITDSAGFWLVVFCGFGLCLLMLMHRTINKRLKENAARAVVQASEQLTVYENVDPKQVSSRNNMAWVYVILGLGLVAGWIILARRWLVWSTSGGEPDQQLQWEESANHST